MSNNLREAADLLSNGWCKGILKDGDKYCAVGALAKVVMDADEFYLAENDKYDIIQDLEEAKVLAETIAEHHPIVYYPDAKDLTMQPYLDLGEYADIMYLFNDAQESVEPVIQMFEKAAVKWDEING